MTHPNDYMGANDPDDLNLADVHYWSMFGRIRHFLRGLSHDPDHLQISLYPTRCRYSIDVVWTWWAWPAVLEEEPEDNHTNYYRAGRGFEFYGIAEKNND